MAQDPKANSSVMKGTAITLTINTGDPGTAQQDSTSTDSTAQATGSWSTNSTLLEAPDYTGGPFRLTLVQTVNGTDYETTLDEGNSITFPYALKYNKGADGVSSGYVYIYEEVNGNYVKKNRWPVTFSA